MLNVMLTGVGGQGTVLAAKVLAQAAQEKGWHVRTAETIGMAQRGGSVVSHVRMGNDGEEVFSPLIAEETADMIIAFEPAEGAPNPYRGSDVIDRLYAMFEVGSNRLVVVPDEWVLDQLGNRKALNTVLLASAIATGRLPLSIDDLRAAIKACVKPQFVDMNLEAIDIAVG